MIMKISRGALFVCALLIVGCNEKEEWTEPPSTFSCIDPFVKCGDSCIDPMTTNEYCGADHACAGYVVCDAGETCTNGFCVNPANACPTAGQVKCDGTCIDPQTSSEYCGANIVCSDYARCSADRECVSGRCVPRKETDFCPADGQVRCNGICVDPKSSNDFCGADSACENYDKCDENERCTAGECKPTGDTDLCEDASQVRCNGSCIDPKTSNDFCGADSACANYDKCDENERCTAGECKPIGNTDLCEDASQVRCDGSCIDPQTSNDYCGADETCTTFDACDTDETCVSGECKPKGDTVVCTIDGQVKCNNTCIDPSTSKEFCGADATCEHFDTCETNESCVSGECKPDQVTCNENEHINGDSCEADDLNNCGAHGVKCAETIADWADGTCTNGKCVATKCVSGKHPNSDGNYCFSDNLQNCGAEGYECAAKVYGWGNGECVDGVCVVTKCSSVAGTHLSTTVENTCEDDDLDNCGEAGRACKDIIDGWTDGSCTKGNCVVSACKADMHLLEKSNKCEADDIENCGAPEKSCANEITDWAEGTCTEAKCVLTKCTDGKHLAETPNTCEADTLTNCGDKHDDCSALGELYVCSKGVCKGSCDNELAFCDSAKACVDVTSDANHCGECDNVCSTDGVSNALTMACESSSCVVATCTESYSVVEVEGKKQCGCAEGYAEKDSEKCCIDFADAEFGMYALTAAEDAGTSNEHKWDTNGDGCITPEEAESEKVLTLTAKAFQNNTNIKSAQDLNRFKHIWRVDNNAFNGSGLTGKVEWKYVTSIGMAGLKGTTITEVDFPELTTTDGGVFWNCSNLVKVNLPKLEKLGASLFNTVPGLTEVDLPSAKNLGNLIFTNSQNITTVRLTAPGKIEYTATTWKNFDPSKADLYLNKDKEAGGSGLPLVGADNEWAGVTWHSITFVEVE